MRTSKVMMKMTLICVPDPAQPSQAKPTRPDRTSPVLFARDLISAKENDLTQLPAMPAASPKTTRNNAVCK
jgi:hypothetical protein